MKNRKNDLEQGFTLIEIMIVMLVISILLIITIPNIAKHNKNINNKGCQAYVRMVEAQVQAYEMDLHTTPTMADLIREGYLNENVKGCPNGKTVTIGSDGSVSAAE
ncbi:MULTISPECIES: competence type IV pilus major pilin ComGC [Bacillaceae]|uniref:competence type IV pilus major pilin ComGC n=1 Tax=Bacillaceae TaxID=186817 RepID=UPI002FFF28EE